MRDEERDLASFEGDAPRAATLAVLHDRRELALVALERTRMPMVVCDAADPDTPIMLVNQAFLDLTGYPAGEVIGRNCRFLQGPDTDPKSIQAIRAGLAAHRDVEVELLNYRKDGSSFWNQLAISPIHGDDGALLYYFASQKDVSARRRAEATEAAERLLLMEIDHRAMNALTLVQSFVRLSRTDSVEGYATSVQQRVDALARAHRLLAHNGWASAGLAELVEMEIPAALLAQVVAKGPALALSAKVVQPLALALHELMANALAYGALASPSGRIEIEWDTAEGRTALSWRERGTPRAGAPIEGLGLGLVRGVIERQLGGEVRLDWTEDGLDARLSFAPEGPRAANAARSAFRSPAA